MPAVGRISKVLLASGLLSLFWLLYSTTSRASFNTESEPQFDVIPKDTYGFAPNDVVLVLKSGYEVLEERLLPQLATFANPKYGRTENNTMIIADYNTTAGEGRWKVRDVLAPLSAYPNVTNSEKFAIYKAQSADIKEQPDRKGIKPGTNNNGWALDTYKFIPGWHLAAREFPDAKWFVGVDDDTYVIWHNLLEFLSLLNHTERRYMGTAAYLQANSAKFIHGGSIIVASQAAMQHRFITHGANSELAEYHHLATDLCCGDGVLGMSFTDVGIPPDDAFRSFFNGATPRSTRLNKHNFCHPVMGLHHVTPEVMRQLEITISRRNEAAMLGAPRGWISRYELVRLIDLDLHLSDAAYQGVKDWDYVSVKAQGDTGGDQDVDEGAGDGGKRQLEWPSDNHATAKYCAEACTNEAEGCLAWTFDGDRGECWLSGSMVPGRAAKGFVSGLNQRRLETMERDCIASNGSEWHKMIREDSARRRGFKLPEFIRPAQ